MSEITRFGVSINENLLNAFDELIEKEKYNNRSDAIRDLIREKLVMASWKDDDKDVVGTITIIYDHHSSDITENLVHIQHDDYKSVISTTHIHLDEHNCLEVLIVNGKSGKIKNIAENLLRAKGVKHGKLTMTVKGDEL